jgi:gluconate 2-dehydrogenase gamma chain
MTDLARRSFLGAAGAAAIGTASVPAVGRERGAAPDARRPAGEPPYAYLDAQEARFVEAAVARLVPSDELGPGAVEAGVPAFIDRQLAGAWGAGERLYRAGPWQPGLPGQGYQLPFTPAELFRTAMRGIREDLSKAGRAPFEALAPAEQDAYLTALQEDRVELGGVPSKAFFEALLEATIEGFLSDPVHGGNRGMVGWRLLGFPGAHANYYALVDRHNVPLDRLPISLAEDGGGHVHIAPLRRARGR